MKKKINIIIVAVSIFILLAYVFFVDGFENILSVWSAANKWWLLCGVLAMIAYWGIEAGILHVITKSYHPPLRFRQTLRVSMIGQLFNCITPFASGGQPIQMYEMSRSGVPFGVGSCSLLIKFIVYQTALTLASIVVLIVKFAEFSQISGFVWLVFIGFIVNFGVLTFLFCIGFFKGFTEKMVCGFIRFCGKVHLLKHVDTKLEKALIEVEEFYNGFQQIKNNKKLFVVNTLASVVQIIIYSAIPFFIYCAFGNSTETIFAVVSAQIFVSLITAFVPLPGAIGGAEVSFFMFFQMFFPANQLNMAILLWRLLTFYFPIFVGAMFYLKERTDDHHNKAKKETPTET